MDSEMNDATSSIHVAKKRVAGDKTPEEQELTDGMGTNLLKEQ